MGCINRKSVFGAKGRTGYPDFFCGDGQSVPDGWQAVTTPPTAQHYLETGQSFTHIYDGSPEDVWGTERAGAGKTVPPGAVRQADRRSVRQ